MLTGIEEIKKENLNLYGSKELMQGVKHKGTSKRFSGK
jgi:hypothetical protein